MKAGQNQFTDICNMPGNFIDDCQVLTWTADCTMVELERIRDGRDCQGMSHSAVR